MRMDSFQFEKHWFNHRSMKFSKKTKSEISKSVIFCVCTVWRERKKRKKSGNALIWSQNQRNSAEKKKNSITSNEIGNFKTNKFWFFCLCSVWRERKSERNRQRKKQHSNFKKLVFFQVFKSKWIGKGQITIQRERYREI